MIGNPLLAAGGLGGLGGVGALGGLGGIGGLGGLSGIGGLGQLGKGGLGQLGKGGKFGKSGKFGQTCVTGRIDQLVFIQAPAPGSITAQLTTLNGQRIGLIPSGLFGGVGFGNLDQQFATVCGVPTISGGQLALIVTAAFPAFV